MDESKCNQLLKIYDEDIKIQNLIAQANSRYILYSSQEPIENFPQYTLDLDEKCLNIAFLYLNLGFAFFKFEKFEKTVYCIEKAAGIIEHLFAYESCNKRYKEYYNLLCGLAYYISSQYSKSFIILKYHTNKTNLSNLLKLFLTRNFRKLEEIISELQFIESNIDEFIIYEKIFSNALAEMMIFINTGNYERLHEAKIILIDLIELAKLNEEPHIWWIFKLFYFVIDEYADSSLWSVLPTVITNTEVLEKYILINRYKSIPVVELFKSQRNCVLEQMVKSESFAVGMPTSSGKTKIAELAILRTLSNHPDALCIYIAPFRSLANEIERSLAGTLNAMGFTVSNLYGNSQVTQLDRHLVGNSNVIIATPEKTKSILRSNEEIENRMKLVVIDEGHLVGLEKRYISSEILVEEIKIILEKNKGSMVLLSAVLPNVSDFAKWIGTNENDVFESQWRPSSQRFGELKLIGNTVSLEWEGENQQSYNDNFIERVEVKKTRNKITYYPRDKKEAIGETAAKMLSMGSVLIFVGRTNMVFSQAKVISDIFLKSENNHHWSNTDDLKYVELACEEAYGENSNFFNWIKQGIVCHSSKLPTDVRQGVERLISNGLAKVIIATTTLGQGVNVGVSTVIISNVYLNEKAVVSNKDFWNIAGRAGRSFTDNEGKILFAIEYGKPSTQKNQRLKKRYFDQKNIEKAKSGLYGLLVELLKISKKCGINYNVFLELLSENREYTNIEIANQFYRDANYWLDLIDDTLLAINVKNNMQTLQENSKWIEEIFVQSLAYLHSQNSKELPPEKMLELIKARNKGVLKLSGSPDKWKSITCSSLPLRGSVFINENIDELLQYVTKFATSQQEYNDLILLIQELDTFIVKKLPISFDEGNLNLDGENISRNDWYAGKCIENEKIMKYYGFHFPWIVNAISKKIGMLNYSIESEILENLSLISEIGVPDIESAKIYLAGIKSRKYAIELSTKIDFTDMSNTTIKKRLFNLLDDISKVDLSSQSLEWIKLLKKSEEFNYIKEIRQKKIEIPNYNERYTKLYVKKVQNKIYLSSDDYKYKILIKKDKQIYFEHLVEQEGLLFVRDENNEIWTLKSYNPYIQIVE